MGYYWTGNDIGLLCLELGVALYIHGSDQVSLRVGDYWSAKS